MGKNSKKKDYECNRGKEKDSEIMLRKEYEQHWLMEGMGGKENDGIIPSKSSMVFSSLATDLSANSARVSA